MPKNLQVCVIQLAIDTATVTIVPSLQLFHPLLWNDNSACNIKYNRQRNCLGSPASTCQQLLCLNEIKLAIIKRRCTFLPRTPKTQVTNGKRSTNLSVRLLPRACVWLCWLFWCQSAVIDSHREWVLELPKSLDKMNSAQKRKSWFLSELEHSDDNWIVN